VLLVILYFEDIDISTMCFAYSLYKGFKNGQLEMSITQCNTMKSKVIFLKWNVNYL